MSVFFCSSRRRHTRWPRDWSSDVCSSDLHVLPEAEPGLGKTRFVRSFAQATDMSFGRIQFTPDLMPADVTGTTVFNEEGRHARFEFQPGPIFANVLLADEIDRATPKTQAALLEAMEERAVTVAGKRHPLPEPL